MQLKTETDTIDDIQFTTTQFPAMRQFKLLTRLVKTVGPALGAIAVMDPTTDVALQGPALMSALAHVEPKEAAELVLEVLQNTTALVAVDGGGLKNVLLASQEKIDDVFSGRIFTMFKVLGFAIRTNYGDFSGGAGANLSALRPPT